VDGPAEGVDSQEVTCPPQESPGPSSRYCLSGGEFRLGSGEVPFDDSSRTNRNPPELPTTPRPPKQPTLAPNLPRMITLLRRILRRLHHEVVFRLSRPKTPGA
jgi:hypothetical protein